MALYDLKMFCNACGEFHLLGKKITLDESFPVRAVSTVYKNSELPPEIALVKTRHVQCPVTDRWVNQPNADRILLVEAERSNQQSVISSQPDDASRGLARIDADQKETGADGRSRSDGWMR